MRTRHPVAATAAAVLLAACSAGSAPATSPPTTVAPPEPVLLAYSYTTGPVYDLTQTQHIAVSMDGDPGVIGDGVELPVVADVETTGSTELSYTVAEGPSPGTSEITVHAAFPEVSVEGTVNGEPIDPASDELGLGDMTPIDFTVIVDELGRIVATPGSEDLGALFGGDLGSLGAGFGSATMTRPLGPAFPEDRPLTVGDTWADETSQELPGGSTLTVSATHEVVAADDLDGIPVLVIESTYRAGAATIDLGAMLGEMFTGFAGPETGTTPTTPALADQIRFVIFLDPTTTSSTTWFDPAAGTVRKATSVSSATMRTEMAFPDETSGEPIGFTMDTTIRSDTAYTLRAASTTS